MRRRLLAAALTVAMGAASVAPALADGAASTRNIILLGTAAGIFITQHTHQVRAKREQQQQVTRRQTAYRDWFYNKYGYYPTYEQFKQWYVQTYGTSPE